MENRNVRLMMKCTALCIVLLAAINGASAQDTLFMRNGSNIVGKVEEIGLDGIKYHLLNDPSNLRVEVAKQEVLKVKLASGREISVSGDPPDVGGYSSAFLKKRNAIKIDFLSPTLQHITLCYEHVFRPWINGEFKVGWIGFGGERSLFSNSTVPNTGFLVKAGVKFINSPSYVMRGMRMAHPLKGGYIKPELMFSSFSTTRYESLYNNNGVYTNKTTSVQFSSLAFNAVLGWQTLLGPGLTFDMFFGIGYGTQWNNGGSSYSSIYGTEIEPYAYSHLYLGKRFPLALSTGMTMGWAF